MIQNRENNQTLSQSYDFQEVSSIDNDISMIKNKNIENKKLLELIVNKTILENFQKIDESVTNLQILFNQIKNQTEKASKKQDEKMEYVSLMEICKHSIPGNIPQNIFINLPKYDIGLKCIKKNMITVFSSLIRNSIQAMKTHGVITIHAYETKKQVIIEIIDTGNGIPEEIMSQLFTKNISTKEFGTGLGTLLAKSIIESHGGTISVKNNPTTFTIKLPFN